MSYILKDNYDLWAEHDARKEEALLHLPICSECSERIQDDFCFVINDMPICESCMNEYYRVSTSDLMVEL
jgi:formylmethanofuran dehydrogenase subunit E